MSAWMSALPYPRLIEESTFSVSLIPETIERTTLGRLSLGDKVNVEVDSQTQTIVETIERLDPEMRADAAGPVGTCRMSFHQRLQDVWQMQNSLVCVGIDPELEKLPAHLRAEKEPYLAFGIRIVDATAPYVCAFKPQAAHFAAAGAEQQLAKLIGYIQDRYPLIPVILDAKRGDIGSTQNLPKGV